MDERLEIKYVPIDQIRPAAYNPRKFDEKQAEQLRASIREFGIVDPFIVNAAPGRENILVGGHFRLKICKEAGMAEVPVVFVNIPDEKQERELNLRLNKNLGEWDWALLAEFDEDLLLGVGFEKDDLLMHFGLEDADDQNIEEDRMEVIQVETPEAPRLKSRATFYTETVEQFEIIRKFFAEDGGVELNVGKLLAMVRAAKDDYSELA